MNPRTLNLILLLALPLVFLGRAQEPDTKKQEPARPARRIVVVVSKSNPITSVTLGELERIFLREKQKWPDGVLITVYERPAEHPIREQFSMIVLRKRPGEMAEYWLNSKLTRGIDAPTVCQSATLLKRYLERVRGGIGYCYEDEVDEAVKTVVFLETK